MPSCDVFYFYGSLFESAGSLLGWIRTHLLLICLSQQRIVSRFSISICLFTCCISKVCNYSSSIEFNEIALLLWAQIIPAIRLVDYVFFLITSCLYWFNCMRGTFTWWYFGVDLKKLINGNYTDLFYEIFRQGISKFYNGKSNSFTSLVNDSSSAKDVTKLDTAYNRKRKALLSSHNVFDWNETHDSGNLSGSMPKKPTSSSRCTFALPDAIRSSESNTSEDSESFHFRPLHFQVKHLPGKALTLCHGHSSSRSLSLSDLLSGNSCSSRN